MLFEDRPRATKRHLKDVQNLKAYLTERLQWDTKPVLKKEGSSPVPGEVPISTYRPYLVAVPVMEEDREFWKRLLREVEEEEKRVIAELEV